MALLLRCEAFSPLPERARALGRELGLGAAESRGLGDELAQLAGSGLLDRAARPPPPLPGTGRGSETASGREDARRMLADLGQRHGAAIVYAGEEGKRRFARALREEAAVPPDTVDFALFDAEGCGRKNGGNVNALVLHAAGDLPARPGIAEGNDSLRALGGHLADLGASLISLLSIAIATLHEEIDTWLRNGRRCTNSFPS